VARPIPLAAPVTSARMGPSSVVRPSIARRRAWSAPPCSAMIESAR
jgi:hypothetical protein